MEASALVPQLEVSCDGREQFCSLWATNSSYGLEGLVSRFMFISGFLFYASDPSSG
jgi:hypothetical protein